MKDKLIKWGFEVQGRLGLSYYYGLSNGPVYISVCLNEEEVEMVTLVIGGQSTIVPNCNNELALINLLYILGLLEV